MPVQRTDARGGRPPLPFAPSPIAALCLSASLRTIDFARLHYSMLIISDYFDHYSYSSDCQNNYFHYITGWSWGHLIISFIYYFLSRAPVNDILK